MIYIIIISILINIIVVKMLVGSKKDNKELELELETLMNMKGMVHKVETKKTKIRNEYNEKENDIDNNDNVDNDILLHDSKAGHNHNFGAPCGKSCPAYSGE